MGGIVLHFYCTYSNEEILLYYLRFCLQDYFLFSFQSRSLLLEDRRKFHANSNVIVRTDFVSFHSKFDYNSRFSIETAFDLMADAISTDFKGEKKQIERSLSIELSYRVHQFKWTKYTHTCTVCTQKKELAELKAGWIIYLAINLIDRVCTRTQ